MNREVNLLSIVAVTIIVLILAPLVGMRFIFPWELGAGSPEAEIFWKLRLPRVMTAFCCGAALAISGMIFQALFRNPLATPFTLGVSSGAALGATMAIRAGLAFSLAGVAGISLAAFGGALLSVALVYLLVRLRPGSSTVTMLLAGVAVNFTFSSFILLIHYSSDMVGSFNIMRWLMGRLEVVGFQPVFQLMPLVLLGGGPGLLLRRVWRYRKILFVGVSLMVGAVVSVCGPIGFVGMMSPHICRRLVGPNHRWLAVASLFFGGTFLVCCDVLARTLIAPSEIPVGVITSLLGGPFFLWLLVRRNMGRDPYEAS